MGYCGMLSSEPNDNGLFHRVSKPMVLREEPPRSFRIVDSTRVHSIGLELGSRRNERITQLAFFGVLLRNIALRAIYQSPGGACFRKGSGSSLVILVLACAQ